MVSGSGKTNSGDSDSLDDHEPSSDARDPPMTESQDPRHGKILHPDPWDWRGCGHGRCSQLDVVKPMSCKRVLMLVNRKK